ncbi:MAG: hypothetical protein ACREK5_10735 [Gemmatimonadota bacterium]
MPTPRRQKPPVPTEVRLLGRLAADPEPSGSGVTLRLQVSYGIERHERTVLATGAGAQAARNLRAGDLAYIVGTRADEDSEHEIHAEHVLARGSDRRETVGNKR